MRDVELAPGDAAELGELLTFLADWIGGDRTTTLNHSLASFVGHTGYDIDTLRADLHRFVFLLGISDGEELFGEPTP